MTTTVERRYAFWDRIAEKYSKQPIADEAAYQKKLEVTRRFLDPAKNVLELGCGTGSTAILHAPLVRRILAVDVSAKMIEIGRGKAEAAGIDNLTFERSTIEELSVDERFDVVLGLSILHLLPDKEAVIAKVYEFLQPGGVFISSTTCLGGLARFFPLRIILPIGRLFGRLPLVKFFSPQQLEDSLTAAGFSIDYRWQVGVGKAVFIVAKKPE